MSSERRPTGLYYEVRTELLSQGDIFDDVPLAYPTVADEIVADSEEVVESSRRFLSGPFDIGKAMLITPTCCMRAQPSGQGYAHPVRTLVPIRTINELMEMGIFDESKRGLADRRDGLINYMYLPADTAIALEESKDIPE